MALNDVKEIQIPQYPYQQVSYLHFNGTDNVFDFGKRMTDPTYGSETILEFELESTDLSYIIGSWSSTARFYLYASSGHLVISWKAPSYTEYTQTLCNVSTGVKYYFRFADTYDSLTLAPRYLITVKQGDDTLYSDVAQSEHFPDNLDVAFMARRTGSNTYDGYAKGKLYKYQTGSGTAASRKTYVPILNTNNRSVGILRIDDTTYTPIYMLGTVDGSSIGSYVSPADIQIPLINVKKIESNNQIIWGSQTYFPYRKLEYIHFSGAEGIDMGFKPASTGNLGVQAVNARITGPTGSSTYGIILGCSGDSTSNGTMRILVQSYEGKVGQRIGRNSSTFGYSTPMAPTKFYNYRLRTTSNSSTYVDIYNDQGQLISGTSHTTSLAYTSANMPNEQLMRYISNGVLIAGGYSTGDVAFFKQWDGSQATGTLIKDMYPVQRKSDGVCGLYDVLNSTFYPMIGTSITSGAAGPIADEYWDLTA